MAIEIIGPKEEIELTVSMLADSNETACMYTEQSQEKDEFKVQGYGLDFTVKETLIC